MTDGRLLIACDGKFIGSIPFRGGERVSIMRPMILPTPLTSGMVPDFGLVDDYYDTYEVRQVAMSFDDGHIYRGMAIVIPSEDRLPKSMRPAYFPFAGQKCPDM